MSTMYTVSTLTTLLCSMLYVKSACVFYAHRQHVHSVFSVWQVTVLT